MYDLLYVLYAGQNRISDAEAVLKAKSENNPQNPFHLIDLAAHYHRMNRRSEMTGVLERLTGNLEDFPEAHEIVGDFYLRIGESNLAIEHYATGRNASSDRDTTKQLTYKIIVALTSARRWDEASEIVEEVLNEDAGDPQALSLRGALRLRTGDKEQIEAAVRDLEGVVRRAPHNAVLRFRLGEAYLANADVHNARLQFREAVKLEPAYLLPKYALMRMHLNSNELTQTTVMAKGILDSYPNDPTAMLARATAWIGLREHERARADLERLLQRRQYQREAMFQLARLDILEKQYRRAEERLLHLVSGSPPDRRALQGLVELYTAVGAPDKARDLLETVVRQASGRLDLRLALARLAAQRGDLDGAVAEIDRILSIDPTNAPAYTLLGEVFLFRGETSAGREQLHTAIDLDPSLPEAFLHIGTLLAREGKLTEARPYFERTLELAPDNAVASNNLAFILAETETDLDQALTHAQRARARAPDNAEFADTLGWVYVRRGLNDNAIDVLSEIVAENPSRAGFRYHLALALIQNGDESRARKELETALGNEPSPEEEGKIRQLLSQLGS
jgi:Flp pilus assembly protein TadD